MYLKIVIDRQGNTKMIKPQAKLDVICPFCKAVNIYIFEEDAKLFCNNCGKSILTQVNNGDGVKEVVEEYSDEQISDFIRILKEGGSIYDRTDAITSLGRVSRNNKRIGTIFNLLYKISMSEPDLEVREYAKESLGKLRGTPVAPVTVKAEETVMSKPVNKEKEKIETETMNHSPFKTYKIEELPEETKKKILSLNENKSNGNMSETPGSNGKNSRFSMEDDLLSLLNDI